MAPMKVHIIYFLKKEDTDKNFRFKNIGTEYVSTVENVFLLNRSDIKNTFLELMATPGMGIRHATKFFGKQNGKQKKESYPIL
jgi:hypothetical protein